MFYGIPPEQRKRFEEALKMISEIYQGRVFAGDMLVTFERNLSFREDAKYAQAYTTTAKSAQEHSLVWRLHVLTWAAAHALHVPGDFVECGVFKGFSFQVICKYLDFATAPKSLYLYDTFSGFPEATSTPEERAKFTQYSKLEPSKWLAEVRESFAAYPNVRIVPGMVPDSFAEACPNQIALLHLDMNSEKAESLALDHLYDRVSSGGMIVLDDFGWMAHHNQMKSQTDFFAQRGHKVLELPTGQGLVLKR